MSIKSLFAPFASSRVRRRSTRRAPNLFPSLESLEERCLLSFNPVGDYDVGLWAQDLVSGDFNGDGRPDLAAANYDEQTSLGTVSVLLGNGDGAFQAARTLATGIDNTQSLQVADLNDDGNDDLVALSGGGSWRLLFANGDGTFQPPVSIALSAQITPDDPDQRLRGQGAFAVAIDDFNHDGRLDLVVGGAVKFITTNAVNGSLEFHETHYINFLLGQGDGTFLRGEVKPSPGRILSAAGDFTNDGELDILSVFGVFPGNGDGTFQDFVRTSSVSFGPLGDFNGDGNLDVLSGSSLSFGNGDGTFQEAEPLGISGFPAVTAAGDTNSDGKLDVVVVSSNVEDFYIDEYIPVSTYSARSFLGNGDGSFTAIDSGLRTVSGLVTFTPPVLADFDGNGFADLAVFEKRFSSEWDDVGFYGGVLIALNDGLWTPPPPTIATSDVSITEGNTGTRSANIIVTLSAASNEPVTVDFATADGTAAAGSDYQAASGTLTFVPGETSKSIQVLVNGDTVFEPNETFVVNLTNPNGATIGDGQGVGTIVNDDTNQPTLGITDVTKNEGNKGKTSFTFTVRLSAPSTQTVTVFFATADGTATVSGRDYTANSGTLTFLPGETSKTVTISVRCDKTAEADETFYVNLSSAQGALIADGQGVGTILNDDGGFLSLDAAYSDPDLMDAVLTGRKRK
jgi:Calx-beta domain/FG-GAP-like repeat